MLFAFIALCNVTQIAQWKKINPYPTGESLNSIFFLNNSTGWIVGRNGTILHTSNAGQAWNEQKRETSSNLNSICFVTESKGWIAGDNDNILMTTDGGKNWTLSHSGNLIDFSSITFVNDSTGWVAGENGVILKTDDGGLSWNAQNSNTPWNINEIFFYNEYYGWCAIPAGLIRTTDGGANWIFSPFPTCRSVFFISQTEGWMGGDVQSEIYHTTDGGITWVTQNRDYQGEAIISLYFTTPLNGWAIEHKYDGDETLHLTSDGGISWTGNRSMGGNFNDVTFVNNEIGWMVGPEGRVLKSTDSGANWESITKILTVELLTDVQTLDKNNVWIAGNSLSMLPSKGITLHTTDGGTNWTLFEYHPEIINSIFFTNEQLGWISCNNGTIGKTTNGGANWQYQQISGGDINYKVFFINSQRGWVCPSSSKIYHSFDSGETWNFSLTPTTFYDVYFVSDSVGWAIEKGAPKIYYTSDGGYNWYLQYDNATVFVLSSLFFTDKENGWVCGYGGKILHTSNGGKNWESQISNTITPLIKLKFINTNIGWIAGKNGTILFTTDGGENWSEQVSNTYNYLLSISFADQEFGIAVGSSGTILKTENGGITYVAENNESTQPKDLLLSQNYPNPFNPITTIKYQIPELSFVTLRIYDVLGNEIETLVDEEKPVGSFDVEFDGTGLPSGIYFYRLQAGSFVETKKMVLMK